MDCCKATAWCGEILVSPHYEVLLRWARQTVYIWPWGELPLRLCGLIRMNRCARPHGCDFTYVNRDAVRIFDFEGGLLEVFGIQRRLTPKAVGEDRVSHVAQSECSGLYVRDADTDVQVVQHSANVLRTVVALVLKNGEIVIAVGQVVADIANALHMKPESIAPEADRLGKVGCSYTNMN